MIQSSYVYLSNKTVKGIAGASHSKHTQYSTLNIIKIQLQENTKYKTDNKENNEKTS